MKTILFVTAVVLQVTAVCPMQADGSPADKLSPFACDRMALSPEARKQHFDLLGPELRRTHLRIRELPDGYEFEFPPDPASVQRVAEWSAGERLCCPFFDIDLRFEREHGAFWLRLTGREGVKQFIQSDFAKWFQTQPDSASMKRE